MDKTPSLPSKTSIRQLYSDNRVIAQILRISEGKEVAGSYGGKGYSKRPDVLNTPGDILEFVTKGVTSFHISEETWQNPLLISDYSQQNRMAELRTGWDLVIDIDCPDFELSQIAAVHLMQTLLELGVASTSIKFSGNHGFHIGIPYQAFPSHIGSQQTTDLFPDLPKRIASLLKSIAKRHLSDDLRSRFSVSELEKRTGASIPQADFDPFAFIEIDTVFLAHRHLFRSVFSINEKSGLVSIPVDPKAVATFDRSTATIEQVLDSLDALLQFPFLDRDTVVLDEAKDLAVLAMDHTPDLSEYTTKENDYPSDYAEFESDEKIAKMHFPPCIYNIWNGLTDGRKRAIFILRNFLNVMNWTPEEITAAITEWNKRNGPPLRETVIRTQLRYVNPKKKILPPNCKDYYEGIGVCTPDSVCRTIKNPVAYAKRRSRYKPEDSEKDPNEKRTLSEEQKQKMREGRERKKQSRERIKKQKEEGTFNEQVEY